MATKSKKKESIALTIEPVPTPVRKIELRLEQQYNGEVSLCTTDGWYVLTLKSDGTFCRNANLSPVFGFQLDSEGRVVETKE